MLLLFHQHTSYNPEYEKQSLKPNCSQNVILKAMHASLYNKYSYAQNYYYTNNLNMIINNQGRPSIIHIYEKEYFECKEYLNKYHDKQVTQKLKKLISIHKQTLNAPRYFLEPISLDLLVDKNYTKKRKLRQRNLQQKQQTQYNNNNNGKFNLVNQFLKMKLISFDPILKDLNDSKPTTMQFVDMLKEYNAYNKQYRNAQFIIEMEQHQKQSVLDDNVKIKQFNEIVSFNKNSNLSGSTRLSSTRIQKEPNIRNILMQHYTSLNYQNFINQRILQQDEKHLSTNKAIFKNTTNQENLQKCNNKVQLTQYKKKQPQPIDVMMESMRSQQQQQQIQSSRANPENKRIQSKPFLSPKGQVTSNINFRRVPSNITKLR
ncbi:unnamed protein product (macronuclear) [Paramecium tetraurelia]|uniref:Uncharacterized protein n=1 Tax=Paramecium tetraurelia TaxID=5888 RepID=A0D303_PARTE|nr:uncharacterized protein GSPATT00012905001 [Paramecium tetraurelia]CAK77420.1 unnamed protein product [Paramecium tetraurelia]|eukprot:XP_001444817.1 hypothetical protein (macronuclear) [Paramecium tetraurelia strain d4-2]